MKILYFSRDYTTHDHRFLRSLAADGHRVFFLQLERRGAQLEDRPLPPQVTLIPWAGGQKPFQFRQIPRLLPSLKQVLRQVQPDLVHAGPLQTAGLLTALTDFHPFAAVSWGSDLLRDADRNSFYCWATRFTLQRSNVMIGDCDAVRRQGIAYGARPERIVTFPWGVDVSHFSPAPDPPADDAKDLRTRLGWQDCFVVISTRSWEPGYGVDELVQGFIQAGRTRPELRLLLLGTGSQAGLLRRMTHQANIQGAVHFAGQVSQQKIPDYFRAADLYISASQSDGSSISLLEALATGTPALVSDIPGNLEWIQDGEHGWIFQKGDVSSLEQALLHAVDSRDELPRMQRAARALAEARGDWELNFHELLRAYRMALGN